MARIQGITRHPKVAVTDRLRVVPWLLIVVGLGIVVAMVVEGPEDTWEVVRGMMGATNPRSAAPGTIRGDLGILFTENLVHGSDSLASAEREIGIFFPNL